MGAELEKPGPYDPEYVVTYEPIVGEKSGLINDAEYAALSEDPYHRLEVNLQWQQTTADSLTGYWMFFREVAAPGGDPDIPKDLQAEAHKFIRHELEAGKTPDQIMDRASRQADDLVDKVGVAAEQEETAQKEQARREARRLKNRLRNYLNADKNTNESKE